MVGKWIARVIVGIVVYGLMLFLAAGRLDWGWGWVLLGVLVAVMMAHPLILWPLNPTVLIEREQGLWQNGVKSWDKWLTMLAGGLMLLTWIVAGLDVRFQWSRAWPFGYHLGGLLVVIVGYTLFLWAMAVNPFFSPGVRIQTERGHVTVMSGPYRYVRHPGYVGMILVQLATPFLLGSWWALLPSGLLAVLLVVRTGWEDKTLLAELPGYPEFMEQTPARLWPGVW